jgi:hypothetical protein
MRRIIQLPQSGLVQRPLCYVDLEQGTIGFLNIDVAWTVLYISIIGLTRIYGNAWTGRRTNNE